MWGASTRPRAAPDLGISLQGRRLYSNLRPIGHASGSQQTRGRTARRQGWPIYAWIALAHGLRHLGSFRRLHDRFLDHSVALAWQYRPAADSAGGPWRGPGIGGHRG